MLVCWDRIQITNSNLWNLSLIFSAFVRFFEDITHLPELPDALASIKTRFWQWNLQQYSALFTRLHFCHQKVVSWVRPNIWFHKMGLKFGYQAHPNISWPKCNVLTCHTTFNCLVVRCLSTLIVSDGGKALLHLWFNLIVCLFYITSYDKKDRNVSIQGER